MKDLQYIIAENVRLYRKKENLTQAGLAERADLSLDSIKRVEGGKRTMSLENFMRIVEALKVPLSFLLYENADVIPETESLICIFEGKSQKQKEYLLHMLQELAEGLDKLME